MQIGCGVRVMQVKGHAYIYIWHYENLDGARKPVYEYIGPASNPESGRKAADAMEEYAQKAITEIRRQLRSTKAETIAVTR
jgi:hypothetical protein